MTETAPTPSARCARHHELPAVQLCSRCGDWVCERCWSAARGVCDVCAAREPLFLVPPLPWEQAELSLTQRLLGTLWALCRPWSRAAAFARGDVSQAARFALLVAVPLAALSTLIPLTRTLLFANRTITLLGAPTPADIAWDVLRALALGPVALLVMLVPVWLGLLMGSLFRTPKIWLRDVLYWSWLHPWLLLLTYGVAWLTQDPRSWSGLIQLPFSVAWWLSQWYVARRASLAGWPRTFLTVFLGSLGWLLGFVLIGGLFPLFAPGVAP